MKTLALGSVLRRTWKKSSFYESRVICQSLKPEQPRKFECIDGIMYYRSRIIDKMQFKFADLDFVPFLDVH